MKTIKLTSGTRLKLYDSVKDFPINRHHEFQKLVMQDAEIGSTMESVGQHLSSVFTFINNEKYEEAKQEAVNLHNNFFYALEGINIKSLCFVTMIHSIDDQLITDLSVENVRRIVDDLSKKGLTIGDVESQVLEVKKKLQTNFSPNFLINTELPETLIP